jgi:hypothetical protein
MVDDGVEPVGPADEPVAAPDTAACAPPIDEPIPEPATMEVLLVEVEPALVLLGATDGSPDAYLVPAYRFTAEDGTTLDVPAVADEALAPPAPASTTTSLDPNVSTTTPSVDPCETVSAVTASPPPDCGIAEPIELPAGEEPVIGVGYYVDVQVLDGHCTWITAEVAGRLIENHYDGFDLRSSKPHQRFRQYFHSSAWCHPVFGLVRRDVLQKTGLIGNFASSDKVLLGELAVLGKCYEYPEHLAYRRLHPQISTEVHVTDESMQAWFDPNARKSVLTPRWRRFVELGRAINRANISWKDRLLCYGELVRFYVSPGRVKGVFKDLSQIFKFIPRLFSKT